MSSLGSTITILWSGLGKSSAGMAKSTTILNSSGLLSSPLWCLTRILLGSGNTSDSGQSLNESKEERKEEKKREKTLKIYISKKNKIFKFNGEFRLKRK